MMKHGKEVKPKMTEAEKEEKAKEVEAKKEKFRSFLKVMGMSKDTK